MSEQTNTRDLDTQLHIAEGVAEELRRDLAEARSALKVAEGFAKGVQAERDSERKRADGIDGEAGLKLGALVKERDALRAERDRMAGDLERARDRTAMAEAALDQHRAFSWGVEWGREGYRRVMARFKCDSDAAKFAGVTSGLRPQVVDLRSHATAPPQAATAPPNPAPPRESSEPIARATDLVNHPPHYTSHPSGVECIQITEHMPFCLGNAIKYLWRCDGKNGVEDLRKAEWYVRREIAKREAEAAKGGPS